MQTSSSHRVAIACALLALAARAQVGPDVRISALGPGLTKWGAIGGVGAYSLEVATCNVGDQDAPWVQGNNQHPVTGTQLYRLKSVGGATRFEQLGASWMLHGTCALDQPGCGGSFAPEPTCDYLGLDALTDDSAAVAASQQFLGRRVDIDAWTGAFSHPYIGMGQTGNAIFKRLQVVQSELDPALNAGALYFGEAQIVTPGETTDSTRFDDCSWRRVVVGAFTSGQYGLAFTAATSAGQPAIHAWKLNDASVTLVDVDVPSDGRFVLGYDVTNLGNGKWRYEYALFNQNSHRGGQALRAPLGFGVALTNVGFHDVDSHSGDPTSSVDWTATVTPASDVTWATETYSQNVFANALRFGTLYNFRFDANSPPTAGNLTLSLFRSGMPASIDIAALVPSSYPSPVSYCTSGTTTNGCAATISWSGAPSVSASSGFSLDVAGVEGDKQGLVFYGLSGAHNAPWGGGSASFLCVKAPTQRTPPSNSGRSANTCNGSLSIDWLVYLATHATALGNPFPAGTDVWAQAWFRDPPSPKTTNLSNGLQFTTSP